MLELLFCVVEFGRTNCVLCVFVQGMDEGGFDYAFNRAIDAYYNDRAWFRALQVGSMRGSCRVGGKNVSVCD